MPETDQPLRHWLARRPALLVRALCAAATVVFFACDVLGASRWVLLALFVPTMSSYALQFVRFRQQRGGAPAFSKDPDDYR